MKTSMASVTFRSKSKEEVVQIAVNARLDAIEWGGDIHVPAGDIEGARNALALCQSNNLSISAYGSYYSAKADESFEDVLQTAVALKSRVIRVWAGKCASDGVTFAQRSAIVNALKLACDKAARVGCVLATEYHANTLTDTLKSTLELLNEVPLLKTLWQPPIGRAYSQNLTELNCIKNKIENLHVYHRSFDGECRPFSEGESNWRDYLFFCKQNTNARYATLEFVKDNTEQQFYEDAELLHTLIKENCNDYQTI